MMFKRLGIGIFAVLASVFFMSLDAQAVSVAAFGDSITRGWPYRTDDADGLENDGGYIPGLQSQLNDDNWGLGSTVTVYNWGHPGEYVFYEGRYRFPSPVLDSNPDYILIMEGTNDLALGIGPGAISDKLDAIVDEVLVAGLIPVMGTLLPRFDEHDYVDITGVNDNIYVNATSRGIDVADLYSASENWNAIMTDGLHPNTTGYALMADVWFATLKALEGTLTLLNNVINDNGGRLSDTDFPSFVDGSPQAWNVATKVSSNVQHTVSQTDQHGYKAGVWGEACATNGTITILPGHSETCTITNDDIPPVVPTIFYPLLLE